MDAVRVTAPGIQSQVPVADFSLGVCFPHTLWHRPAFLVNGRRSGNANQKSAESSEHANSVWCVTQPAAASEHFTRQLARLQASVPRDAGVRGVKMEVTYRAQILS